VKSIDPYAVLSYGEDPLTYYILTDRLSEFLDAVEDTTPCNRVLVIYRPSFGRGIGVSKSTRKSTFGEFDGIVASQEAVYLIESKWHRSSEVRRRAVTIRDSQIRRHKIFRWYRSHWKPEFKGNWNAFLERYATDFEREFEMSSIPSEGTLLGRNLEFVLGQLDTYSQQLIDVLLYIGDQGKKVPTRVVPQEFKLITLSYNGLGRTGYFEMGNSR